MELICSRPQVTSSGTILGHIAVATRRTSFLHFSLRPTLGRLGTSRVHLVLLSRAGPCIHVVHLCCPWQSNPLLSWNCVFSYTLYSYSVHNEDFGNVRPYEDSLQTKQLHWAVRFPYASQLRKLACHMGPHSFTCHPGEAKFS